MVRLSDISIVDLWFADWFGSVERKRTHRDLSVLNFHLTISVERTISKTTTRTARRNEPLLCCRMRNFRLEVCNQAHAPSFVGRAHIGEGANFLEM